MRERRRFRRLSIGALSMSKASGTDVLWPERATPTTRGLVLREGILRSADGGNTWTLIQQSNDGVAGNHSFAGLSVAGFAWSSTTPTTVVAALSQSAEGTSGERARRKLQRDGALLLTRRGRHLADAIIEDGTGQYVQRAATAILSRQRRDRVAWNPVRQMFYAAVRFHGYYQSPTASSGRA